MRVSKRVNGISVHGISGSRTVLFAMNATAAARKNLMGFAIGRTINGQIKWLNGFKVFRSLVPNPRPEDTVSTLDHPVQSFRWGHYSADPDRRYDYVVRPLYRPQNGDLSALVPGTDIELNISTQPIEANKHAIFFNRGAVPSQAFARLFGNRPPADENNPAADDVKWLSRGLLEGALGFIRQARSNRFALRAAFYEFKYVPIMRALADAAQAGADVKIVYEAGSEKRDGVLKPTSTTNGNEDAIRDLPFDHGLLIKRLKRGDIPHNKFIVLLENGHPVAVWTGSTNITASGFLGQSNVGHIVRDEAVARAFHAYWQQLSGDPDIDTLKSWCSANPADLAAGLPATGITTVFSPRKKSKMLDWYGERAAGAVQTVMLTSAFGVAPKLAAYFDNDRDYLRMLLMEVPSKSPETQALLTRDKDTEVAIAPTLNKDAIALALEGHELDFWFRERHYRDRGGGHVFYIHTKIMIVDPLTDDPLVFSGSANFSPNSLLQNDENMLLIRGEKDVADVYVTEFARLFNHLYFRYVAQETAKRGNFDPEASKFLREDDTWSNASFRPGTYHFLRRQLFGVPAE